MNTFDSQITKKKDNDVIFQEPLMRRLSRTNLSNKQISLVSNIINSIIRFHGLTMPKMPVSLTTIGRELNKEAILFHQECVDIMKNSIGIALSFDETKIKKTTEYLAVCCRALRNDFTLHEFIFCIG